MTNGTIDLSEWLFATDERREKVEFTNPYMKVCYFSQQKSSHISQSVIWQESIGCLQIFYVAFESNPKILKPLSKISDQYQSFNEVLIDLQND